MAADRNERDALERTGIYERNGVLSPEAEPLIFQMED